MTELHSIDMNTIKVYWGGPTSLAGEAERPTLVASPRTTIGPKVKDRQFIGRGIKYVRFLIEIFQILISLNLSE